tara:strand:- start:80 stop:310 length:231 start_codon:yes stop_codon:yes gene_type:complete
MYFQDGDIVNYTKLEVPVKIIKVHHDDIEPYYTIRHKNGKEIQTVPKYLAKITKTSSLKTRKSKRRANSNSRKKSV